MIRRMNTLRRSLFLGLVAALATVGCASAPVKPPARQILVLGGTGQLGAEIVRVLVGKGEQVSVLVRPNSDRSRLAGLPVRYVTGDVLNAGEMAGVFRSRRFNVLISALRVETGDIHFYEKAFTVLLPQAKARGISQIIHHGAVGAGANAAKFASLGWERVPGLLDRLRDQGVGESLIARSGIPYTIIRNTRLYRDGTPATGRAELTTDDTVISPMTRADLARLTVQCTGNSECLNKTYHVRDSSLSWPPAPAAP